MALPRALSVYCRARGGDSDAAAMIPELDGGASLSEAMRRRPDRFPAWQAEVVAVGEATGRLDQVLDAVAGALEVRRAFLLAVVPKLAYPLLIINFAPFAVYSYTIGTDGVGPYLLHAASTLVPFYMLAGAAFWLYRRAGPGAAALRRLPLGASFIKSSFAANLSALVGAGVAFPRALELAGAASGLDPGEPELAAALGAAARGASALGCLRALRLFDIEELGQLEAAETAGMLERELARVAGMCRERNQAALESAAALLGPAVMVLVGLWVAFKLAGFYKGIFTMPRF